MHDAIVLLVVFAVLAGCVLVSTDPHINRCGLCLGGGKYQGNVCPLCSGSGKRL